MGSFSPRERGEFRFFAPITPRPFLFPARAGVIPELRAVSPAGPSIPRENGTGRNSINVTRPLSSGVSRAAQIRVGIIV